MDKSVRSVWGPEDKSLLLSEEAHRAPGVALLWGQGQGTCSEG